MNKIVLYFENLLYMRKTRRVRWLRACMCGGEEGGGGKGGGEETVGEITAGPHSLRFRLRLRLQPTSQPVS